MIIFLLGVEGWKNCRIGGKRPTGISEICETLRRLRYLLWFQPPAQLAAPVSCSVTSAYVRRPTTSRKCTAIRDFYVGVYTGCFALKYQLIALFIPWVKHTLNYVGLVHKIYIIPTCFNPLGSSSGSWCSCFWNYWIFLGFVDIIGVVAACL